MWINVVEDENTLNTLLTKYLIMEGYSVRSCLNGEEARRVLEAPVSLWVIDIMLPDTNGFTLFNEVKKKNPDVHVIFISARNEAMDRVEGLEFGCDDYISKPFLARELVIKVNRILHEKQESNKILMMGPYRVLVNTHSIEDEQEVLDLTVKEYDLLFYLFNNSGIILSREDILLHVWGHTYYGSDRVVDDTIRRIRNKLPKLDIKTIYGMGYCLNEKDN